MADAPEVLFERRGSAGIITLNRPKALNAVTLGMVRAMRARLDAWHSDPGVTRVVITGSGDRAFSAGGDIRQVWELGRAGRQQEALVYWREEYQLNTVIKRYAKPYIALIDGIVMGGGVGVSIHGTHRVAGDKFLFAMPEANIGFFPDIGATWFLPRMPGELGAWCALTADRLRAGDGLAAGVATHRVSSGRLGDVLDALCGTASVDAILADFAVPGEGGPITTAIAAINSLFVGDTVEAVLANLDRAAASAGPAAGWAKGTAATIRSRSPTSLKIALAQVRRGGQMTFEECMRTEFRIVSRIVYGKDFYEGVRATLVDKDNAPKWHPAALADVSDTDVEHYFAPLADELVVP